GRDVTCPAPKVSTRGRTPFGERPKSDRHSPPRVPREVWDLVSPGEVRREGHDEDASMGGDEIALPFRSPRSKSKRPRRTERDGDDRRALDHVDRAVTVLADVMLVGRVVPVEEDAVQTRVDRTPSPLDERREPRRDRQRPVDATRVV